MLGGRKSRGAHVSGGTLVVPSLKMALSMLSSDSGPDAPAGTHTAYRLVVAWQEVRRHAPIRATSVEASPAPDSCQLKTEYLCEASATRSAEESRCTVPVAPSKSSIRPMLAITSSPSHAPSVWSEMAKAAASAMTQSYPLAESSCGDPHIPAIWLMLL